MAVMFSLMCAWTNSRANYRDAGDLRLHDAHCDVTVMTPDDAIQMDEKISRNSVTFLVLITIITISTVHYALGLVVFCFVVQPSMPPETTNLALRRYLFFFCMVIVWGLTGLGWLIYPLLWRHNECDGVSNQRRLDCLLNRLFRHSSRKTSNLRVTGLCAGNSPVTYEFLAQRASNAEKVFIWWSHHAIPFTVVSLAFVLNVLKFYLFYILSPWEQHLSTPHSLTSIHCVKIKMLWHIPMYFVE